MIAPRYYIYWVSALYISASLPQDIAFRDHDFNYIARIKLPPYFIAGTALLILSIYL